jgi:peptidyl-prolyl cis-trans isomerase B (cyclophilin B)
VTSPHRLTIALVIALLALSSGCGSDKATPKADHAQCSYPSDGQKPAKPVDKPPGNPDKSAPTEVTISTDRGDVRVSLDADKAPCTVNSFLSLAKQGYFDKTPCHRLTVESIFVLQCGDPSGTGTQGPGYKLADELVDQDPRLQPCLGQTDPSTGKELCTYTAGTVAMANGGPDTNGSQFFLVYKDSPLPAAYTVFGRMSASGVKVVRSVAAKGVSPGTEQPLEPVTITSVK